MVVGRGKTVGAGDWEVHLVMQGSPVMVTGPRAPVGGEREAE